MSKSCSTSLFVSLIVSLTVCLAWVTVVPGQTKEQTRPRSLAGSQNQSVEVSDEANLQAGSPEARAKAKKLYKAGVDYGAAGFFPQATELYQRALRLDPEYADAYKSLGKAYSGMRDWDKAVHSLEQAVALDPKDGEAQEQLDHARLMLKSEPERTDPQASAREKESKAALAAPKVSANEMSLTKVYRVGPGDVLEVSFDGDQPSESGSFTVSTSGFLNHPKFAEPMLVAGLTTDEIEAQLENVRKQRVSSEGGNVTVGVSDYVSHKILVSGLVKDPGPKILRREAIPISVVVADAQPLPEAGRAIIVRSEPSGTFTVDLTEPADLSALVHPGDVITIQATPRQFFYVAGDVKAPGEKTFRRGLTLTQAIITAGGLNGKSGEARLARDNGNGFLTVTRYKLKDIESGKLQDPMIQPGDRITIKN